MKFSRWVLVAMMAWLVSACAGRMARPPTLPQAVEPAAIAAAVVVAGAAGLARLWVRDLVLVMQAMQHAGGPDGFRHGA